jgi:hypothetical protein
MKKINDISDKNPFKVPEGYFEEVNRKIIGLTSDKTPDERKSSIYQRFRPYLLAAASVTGFIILSFAAIRLINSHRISVHSETRISEDYYSPLINELDIFSIEENAATVEVPEEGADVSKVEIIDYLVLDNIEISEIYEQL